MEHASLQRGYILLPGLIMAVLCTACASPTPTVGDKLITDAQTLAFLGTACASPTPTVGDELLTDAQTLAFLDDPIIYQPSGDRTFTINMPVPTPYFQQTAATPSPVPIDMPATTPPPIATRTPSPPAQCPSPGNPTVKVYPVKLEEIQAYLNGGGTLANLEKLLNWEENILSVSAKGRGVAKLYHTDLTGDSVPDVLISSQASFRYYTPHTKLLFFFCRDGQYEGGPTLSVDGSIFHDSSLGVWHIGDMNSNGVPEVVFSEESYGRSVHIMEWNGNQMVPLVKNIANAITVARGDARIVDVDGNGTLELVVRHNFSCLEKAVRPDRVDVYAWDGHYFSLAYSEELTQSTCHIPPTAVLEHSGWSTYNIYDGVVGNHVTAIAVGPDDTLWFGSFEGGVSHFDGQTWTTYTTNEGLLSNYVLSIAIAPDGVVWLANVGGVSRSDGQAWTTYTEKDGLTNWKKVTAIAVAVAPDGTVWFGTWHSGVSYFDGEAWHSALDDNIVTSITVTLDGTVWFGTLWNGVFRFDGETWINYTTEDGLASDSVLSIAVIPDNALWFGTTGGVSRFDGQTWITYTTDDGLPDNTVLSIAVGHDGVLWFGTDSGVTRFDGKSWVTYTIADGLADNRVVSIAVASDGALWFGTEYGGVSRYLPPN